MKFIFKEITKKPVEYAVLTIIFFLSLILYYVYRFQPLIQNIVAIVFVCLYFFWSVFYHYRRGDLHISIVVEYLVFAIFAIVLLTATTL